jgi:Holliday junction DNA helicase RuvA
MITYLRGRLIDALPTQVTVEVGGVGYEAQIPLSSFDKLPAIGHEVQLLTHLAIREDAHVLYGFATSRERELFRLLIHTVNGIGPKIALNVLSGMSVATLHGAVANSDVKALAKISGVGKKTAERIVVELKDKIGPAGAWEASSEQRAVNPSDKRLNDAALALITLGRKHADALEAVRGAQALLGTEATVEELVRAGLKQSA